MSPTPILMALNSCFRLFNPNKQYIQQATCGQPSKPVKLVNQNYPFYNVFNRRPKGPSPEIVIYMGEGKNFSRMFLSEELASSKPKGPQDLAKILGCPGCSGALGNGQIPRLPGLPMGVPEMPWDTLKPAQHFSQRFQSYIPLVPLGYGSRQQVWCYLFNSCITCGGASEAVSGMTWNKYLACGEEHPKVGI
ncbi:hypothetical protein BT96DRAFT_949349 [Gymnopus androsaceus JB14]|uniref:Uncharacterized protein n=1 Tax=Gymnopus androsaceus JB14 TaxID=1447944 RepID=A0A6A4GL93_9AGAR|nr:hypothetical protein BT96DRAFT_949349 [Gymnopus androsaceus JB14]